MKIIFWFWRIVNNLQAGLLCEPVRQAWIEGLLATESQMIKWKGSYLLKDLPACVRPYIHFVTALAAARSVSWRVAPIESI